MTDDELDPGRRVTLAQESICVATDGAVSAREAKDVLMGAGDRANVHRAATRLAEGLDVHPGDVSERFDDPAVTFEHLGLPVLDDELPDLREAPAEDVGELTTTLLRGVFDEASAERRDAVDATPGAVGVTGDLLDAAADHFGCDSVAELDRRARTEDWREVVSGAERGPPSEIDVGDVDLTRGDGLER